MIIIMAKSFAEANAVANSMGIPKMLWRPASEGVFRGTDNLTVIVGDGWHKVDGFKKDLINNLLHHAKQRGRVKWMFHEESMRPR